MILNHLKLQSLKSSISKKQFRSQKMKNTWYLQFSIQNIIPKNIVPKAYKQRKTNINKFSTFYQFYPVPIQLIKVKYIYFLQMDNNIETDLKHSFKKGMTLSEYMQQMQPDNQSPAQDQIPQSNEDLYDTCLLQYQKSPSTKLIPFNIPEMDEDNYESSVDFAPQTPMFNSAQDESLIKQEPVVLKEKPLKKAQIQMTTMYNPKNKEKTEPRFDKQPNKDYRIKHLSNSPYKRQYEFTPTKTNLSKTLYGNSFLSNNLSTASSTLYQNKLLKIGEKTIQGDTALGAKGTIHSRESKNEKYFHQKNKRDIDNMIQYENNIRMKYNSKINVLDIRVDGFRDKLYERKNRIFY